MPFDFFFSYTRANNDDAYLKQFFEDLSKEVRTIRGLGLGAAVGFFDQRELELGEDWDHSIVDALQTSSVLVAISSPGFFKSEYCGKELALFRQRFPPLAPGQSVPPLLKPIIWYPFQDREVPSAFKPGHFVFRDPQAIQNTKGFRYLLKQLQVYKTEYNNLVEELAREIVEAADKFPLKPLPQPPALKDVVSMWTPAPGALQVAPQRPSGPKHVRFVFVAANPQAFGNARLPGPYEENGGGDWKPFFPDKARVHRLVQNIVTADDLDFTSDELPFTSDLKEEIDRAEALRQIVILVVDGWSLHWDAQSQKYRPTLSALDKSFGYHWCVIVPWNDQDADSVAVRADILKAVTDTFDFHARLARNPMFFRDGFNDGIKSPADLKQALAQVLAGLKEEIKKRASVDVPVPAGPSKSTISGPAAQG